jgi:hypothetical protein
LGSWVLFIAVTGFFYSCRDFENPVDPELPGAVPPSPYELQVTTIPYDDFRILRGQFQFEWENASGIEVQRKLADSGDFEVLDTLMMPLLDFSDRISNEEMMSSEEIENTEDSLLHSFQYRVRAFNENGFSGFSNVASTQSQDSMDLFPPVVTPWHNTNPLVDCKTVDDSLLVLRFKVVDESAIHSFSVNGREVDSTSADGVWYVFIDTLRNYTNPYSFTAVDASEEQRSISDSVTIFYDAPNPPPRVHIRRENDQVHLYWQQATMPDFKVFHLYSGSVETDLSERAGVLDSAGQNRFSESASQADEYKYAVRNSIGKLSA